MGVLLVPLFLQVEASVKFIELQKSKQERITHHLYAEEVECRCGYKECRGYKMSLDTILAFEFTRKEFGKPIKVNSGFRCEKHNVDVGGVDHSRHVLGQALDLRAKNSNDLRRLGVIAKKHFDVVLEYDTFVHCHMENKDLGH